MNMEQVNQREAACIANDMIDAIAENKQMLSDIDGLIGDGDHGVNMNKGFQLFKERIQDKDTTLPAALITLGDVLLMEIGGSMGPLYGTFFSAMGMAGQDAETIDAGCFGQMLSAGVEAVGDLGGAQPGDKTIMDVLVPANTAYQAVLAQNKSLTGCLRAMQSAAEAGRESTLDMAAKVGRASRLGERSRGVPDAGATSCNLLLQTIADGLIERICKGADET